jgi:broad specificity phosphatase PhoE
VIASVLAVVLAAGWLVTSWGSATIVLVRHAEKLPDDSDPSLSEIGQGRAQRLAAMLESAGLAAIYVSEAKRTQETARAVAVASGVEPRVVPAAELKRLLRRLKWRHRGDVVLVVGHSNTVPAIAEGLGTPIGRVADDEYSGLWIITYSRLRGTRLLMLRY